MEASDAASQRYRAKSFRDGHLRRVGDAVVALERDADLVGDEVLFGYTRSCDGG